MSGPSASLVHDTRDDPLDPRRGRFASADVQLSAAALGGDSFVKGFLQAAGYRRMNARTVIALSGRLGLARTFGEAPHAPAPAGPLLRGRRLQRARLRPRHRGPARARSQRPRGPHRRQRPVHRRGGAARGRRASLLGGRVHRRRQRVPARLRAATWATCATRPGWACATAARWGPCAWTGATSSTAVPGRAPTASTSRSAMRFDGQITFPPRRSHAGEAGARRWRLVARADGIRRGGAGAGRAHPGRGGRARPCCSPRCGWSSR